MCLTPWISAATFIIELFIAAWLFSLPKKRDTRIAAWIVVFLAVYQLSSFFLCTKSSVFWNLIGYLAVTWLPALGIHLAQIQTNQRLQYKLFYGLALIFSLGMIFTAPIFLPDAQCDAMFISYHNHPWGFIVYGMYYLGTLGLIVISLIKAYNYTNGINKAKNLIFLIGMLSFIIPAYLIKFTIPFLSNSFPSVFCFFAVFLAACLVLREKPELFLKR